MSEILWFAGIIGVTYIGIKFLLFRGRMIAARSAYTNPEALPQWQESGEFNQEVAGESFYEIQIKKVVEKVGLDASCTAVLELEENNEHDKNAVAVIIEGYQVGYLPRAKAKKFRNGCRIRNIQQYSACKAKLFGGTKSRPNIGVWLDLPKL
jgi:hypothetical protein